MRLYTLLIDESGGKRPSVAARAATGRYYARRGDVTQASKWGKAISDEDPRHPAGLFLRGVAELEAGNLSEAQKLIGEAVALDPQAQYYEALGRAFEGDGVLDDAAEHYGAAIARDSLYVEPLVGRARVLQAQRQWKKAVPDLEAARALEPERAVVHLMLGHSLFELGQKKEAVAPLQEAIKRDPKYGEAHYRLGLAFYDLERVSDAASSFQRAIALAPVGATWIPDATLKLAYSLKPLGRKKEACDAFRLYLDIAPELAVGRRDAKNELVGCP
jgi:tetratricopeptide (TPR) repeat protein